MAGLVFQKQRDSLRYSRAVVVPSDSMREVLMRCYPDTPPARTHVLPWGAPECAYDEVAIAAEAASLRRGGLHAGPPFPPAATIARRKAAQNAGNLSRTREQPPQTG